jgi:hypothetical protein
MSEDTRATEILQIHKRAKSRRENWDDTWNYVAEYIMPRRDSVYTHPNVVKGEKKHRKKYDSSAEHYLELLASALGSMLTNPATLWFGLTTGNRDIDKIHDVRIYLQRFVSRIHQILNNTNFQTEVHPFYLDLGSLGTGVLRVLDDRDDIVRFGARPIFQYFIEENEKGEVDKISCEELMTVRQIFQKFGEDIFDGAEFFEFKKDLDKELTVVYIVLPNKDAKFYKLKPGGKAFLSYYVLKDKPLIMKEEGFNEFPYIISRWVKLSGEAYGRSPSMKELDDVMMTAAMMKDTIRAAQKATDPMMFIPDDGIFGPIDFTPGGITTYRAGMDPNREIVQFQTGSRPDIGLDMIRDVRDRIKQGFFIDQLQLRDGPQMTATEADIRHDQQLRLLAPMLGRLHHEFLKPLIGRVISIMKRRGEIPKPVPKELRDINLEVHFSSQIAKAQRIAEVGNFIRFLEIAQPIVEVYPEAKDVINPDETLRIIADGYGVPAEVINDEKNIEIIREDRANEEQEMLEKQKQLADAETVQKAGPTALKAIEQGV